MGNSNSTTTSYRIPDELLEEIFLLLHVESILRCRCVSKHWRSILESKEFLDRRKSLYQKRHLRLLVAEVCKCPRLRFLPESSSRFEEEEKMVYLHCNFSHAWMSCDGLVCFPSYPFREKIHVLNPSTRQLRRFPLEDEKLNLGNSSFANWTMGFGRDKVTGSYKVVEICPSKTWEVKECYILGVETGEWLKLGTLPSYVLNLRSKSVCVNGSIYWLYEKGHKLLALDLYKQEFHDVSVPTRTTYGTQLANLEDRLVMAQTKGVGPEWMLEILTMDAEEERWSNTDSISLAHISLSPTSTNGIPISFRPIAISKQRDLVFYDNNCTLLKYNPKVDEIRCLSSATYLIAPYLENLVPLPIISSHSLVIEPEPWSTDCPLFVPRHTTSKPDDMITALYFICMICILFFYGF